MPTPIPHILHLYRRAGFGITFQQAKDLSPKPLKDIVDSLFTGSAVATYLREVEPNSVPDRQEAQDQGMSKKEMNMLIRDYTEKLNTGWVKQLYTTQAVVLEKQVLFWHNHFACRIRNPYLLQELNNIHRKFAFVPFRELLINVSKSAAMLQFLNNQQNKKAHPNENFARELMELFTLGRGNYTEQDIRESARAFTGWAFDKDSHEFVFRKKQHDEGGKTFMGRTGNFGGEDIINIIMDNRATAQFIVKKLYKYYVNETIDEQRVSELAAWYYNNQYDTGKLLKKIFASEWFYSPANTGCNIKSPVEFIVGITRKFDITYNNPRVLLGMQKGLGQVLFFPPNVAGWPGGKAWIDSSTLMLRLRLPSLLINDGQIDFDDRLDEPDITTDTVNKKQEPQHSKKFDTNVDWEKISARYKDYSMKQLEAELLALPLDGTFESVVNDGNAVNKELILKILSLPQYQLT